MIVTETAPKANLITISNYNELQKLRTNNEPIVNQTRTNREPKQECKRMKKKTYTPEFGLFWDAYPRKVGKKKAFEAWAKCNGDRPPIETILTAIQKQTQSDMWTKDNGRFVPYPATWLNGQRWEDQVDIQTTPTIRLKEL